jgi:hypothetical protein
MVVAIRDHHEPERTESKLAALLYLAEAYFDLDEDISSVSRTQAALSVLGVSDGLIPFEAEGSDVALEGLLNCDAESDNSPVSFQHK